MSEAIQPKQRPYPGEAWAEIVRRPTLEEFSRAFAPDVVLGGSVVSRPIVGPAGLWAFFQATRAMYERIGFTHEFGTKARTCLEWEGVFAGKPVAGTTIITRDDREAITSVGLYHRPLDQVVAFAEAISRHLASKDTHETAPTQFVAFGGIRVAYRRFGRRGGVPLLLLNYFAANLDKWDPKVTNGFAAEREMILFDYPGIGGSSGETPSTVAELTNACVEFCRALDLTKVDVLGFSLGGMIAQQLAADHPEMVRRIILSGTGPRGGEGMVSDLSADELDDEASLIMNAFFTQSEPSKVAGRAFIERTKLRVENRDVPVSKQAALAEAAAILEWGVIPPTDRFAMLGKIHHPTLIVHGNKDVVITPINAFLLAEHLPNARLIMYPDASHAAFSQHAENFLENAGLFLDA
jgi:pimeloyl-ACP methyl ester carboxylesterase